MTERKKAPPHAWKPGQSGNPKGRPAGTGEVAKMRAALADVLPAVLDTVKAKALEGDMGAARLLLERVLPPLKAVEPAQALTLPDGTLTDQGRAVLASVAAGELSPSQGAQLLAAIATLGKVAELDELAKRIEALEAKHEKA